jgi:hypothetical protein
MGARGSRSAVSSHHPDLVITSAQKRAEERHQYAPLTEPFTSTTTTKSSNTLAIVLGLLLLAVIIYIALFYKGGVKRRRK